MCCNEDFGRKVKQIVGMINSMDAGNNVESYIVFGPLAEAI